MIFQNDLMTAMKTHSSRVAVEYKGEEILYSSLTGMAERIKNRLLNMGFTDQCQIGLCLENRLQLIAAIIGVVSARNVFVPLDSNIPPLRMASMLNDLDLKGIIASRNDTVEKFHGTEILYVEDMLQDELYSLPEPAYNGEDSIYVYFTSGSTGNPKGVIGKNKSLLQFIRWETATFCIDENFRCSQFISPYFDAFLRDIFVPLLAGATICIPPQRDDLLTPENITTWLEQERIRLIHCVPSLFRIINNQLISAASFPDLSLVLLSGEKIIPAELSSWYTLFNDRIQLVNFYGATESTMIRAFYRIQPEDAKSSRIPVGSPIADTDLLILDKDLKPCNTLVPGELYIASSYISKGYLNNPELTASRFVQLPVAGKGELPAYKTGDRARLLANGLVDLIGRDDRQIKLQGIRIELDEIEYVLMRSELLKSAVVIKAGSEGQEYIVACVVPAHNTVVEQQLQHHLQDYLPAYMHPSRILFLEALPLLSNGKVDYRKLNALQELRVIVPPANNTEEKVLLVWKEILGEKLISANDSFQATGGNSLSMMKLIGKIYRVFGIRVALSDLFTRLTIQKQAALIDDSLKNDTLEIPKAPVKDTYRISAAQERIYYNYEVNKNRTSYNMPLAWEMNDEPDMDRIKHVFDQLIERHETLRTSFEISDGQVVQLIAEKVDFSIEVIKADDAKDAVFSFIRPFSLGQAPLFRCGMILVPGGKPLLIMDIHHIICDGLSQQILLTDFIRLYHGVELTPLAIQYKDFAEWEHQFRTSAEYIAHREFWLKQFDGDIPVLEFPVTAETEDLSDRGGNYVFEIDKEAWYAMFEAVKTPDMTVFPSLFALYCIFLCHLTGQEDIICGVTASGRMQDELQSVVGMFVKTLPVRYEIDHNISFVDCLVSLNELLIQANSKQVYDLSDILSELNSRRAVPVRNLFNTAFVLLNFEQQKALQEETGFTPFQFENPNSKYPLTLYITEQEHTILFRMEYALAYFSRADMDTLATAFKSIAARIINDPYARIGTLIKGEIKKQQLSRDDFQFNFKRV